MLDLFLFLWPQKPEGLRVKDIAHGFNMEPIYGNPEILINKLLVTAKLLHPYA